MTRDQSMGSAGRIEIPGRPPPELGDLVRAEDRLSFAYFENCVITREGYVPDALPQRGCQLLYHATAART